MSHDIVIEGKAFINHSFQECCIGIDDGKITTIKKILSGDKHFRFTRELILPAGIDVHVHFRDPGMMHKETFYSGSVAAAFGGISCVFDMPNTNPASLNPELLIEKQRMANRKSIVDFGLYAGLSKDILTKDELNFQLGRTCHGFKLFLGETTNSLTIPPELIQPILEKIKPVNKPVFVHAEDNNCLQKHKIIEKNLLDHHNARPPECETTAINLLCSALKSVKIPTHICHVSSSSAVNLLQKNIPNLTYGITPHHSLLHIAMDKKPRSWFKMNPPLRPKTDQQQLFETVKNGNVFLLESDHAPHSLNEKAVSFQEAPCGVPGVETIYPLFLALAEKQQMTYQRVISLLSERPAHLFQLSKGIITPNYDADIIVIDRKKLINIKNDSLHTKAGWSPYEGYHALFPSTVFIRGTTVIKDYEQQVSAGYGSMVPLSNE